MSEKYQFIVTVDTHADLPGLYDDLETIGGTDHVPDRCVDCIDRRPTSRNTIYELTQAEADLLRKDPRVKDVTINPAYLGIAADVTGYVQTSTFFNRSGTTNNTMINWGLLRCFESSGRSGWGSTFVNATGTITLSATGKNVDFIDVDSNGLITAHPEFAVNADGTGGSRCVSYNWYQHNLAVLGRSTSTIYSYSSAGSHAIHVQGTAAGNRQGWARDANIYNIYYDINNAGYTFPYVMNYVTEFHKNKSINPSTGRKNPTIMNNSWGMSLFASDWSFSDITAVTYRGTRYEAPPPPGYTYNGTIGVYNSSTRVSAFTTSSWAMAGNRITSSGSTATTETLNTATSWFGTTVGLTASTIPDVEGYVGGGNDDGYWQLTLPFSITYLGTSYSTVYVGTNFYVTFGAGSTVFATSAISPALPKIMMGSADHSTQRIYYGVEGSTGTRTFRIIQEGASATTGVLGSPDMTCQYTFYENSATVVDVHMGKNAYRTAGGSGFGTTQLNAWGFIAGQRIPQRVTALDSDLEDCLAQGVVSVGASGNGQWKHDAPGGLDWDNTFEMASRYPLSVANPYYYMRGTSPTATDNRTVGNFNINNITVGAIDYASDRKAYFSDCGPATHIWAPGYQIMSSYTSGVADSRNASYYLAKDSGTSMASPQVCGVLACALELYPHWNQDQAKTFILETAITGQLTTSSGGPADTFDLQGSPNLILHYSLQRASTGTVVPSVTERVRPSVGAVYPRPKITRW